MYQSARGPPWGFFFLLLITPFFLAVSALIILYLVITVRTPVRGAGFTGLLTSTAAFRLGGGRLAAHTEPVAAGNGFEWRPQAVQVETGIAAVAKQKTFVVTVPPADAAAHIRHRLLPKDTGVQAGLSKNKGRKSLGLALTEAPFRSIVCINSRLIYIGNVTWLG